MIGTSFGVGNEFTQNVSSPLLFGCEFEIEDIQNHRDASSQVLVATDGSLRNNGFEYITQPMPRGKMVETFKFLHNEISYGPDAFTERTSIHVHVNCCNLEETVVRNIVLLYALFEEAFFCMVSPARRDNIHCVALTETFLPGIYRTQLGHLHSRWHKYTALNVKPLSELGTIEFRHMHGHGDDQLFEQWLGLLENLFTYGKTWSPSPAAFEEDALKSSFVALFKDTPLINVWPNIRAMMGNQIIDVKLSTI